jgi:hypothetical protein
MISSTSGTTSDSKTAWGTTTIFLHSTPSNRRKRRKNNTIVRLLVTLATAKNVTSPVFFCIFHNILLNYTHSPIDTQGFADLEWAEYIFKQKLSISKGKNNSDQRLF